MESLNYYKIIFLVCFIVMNCHNQMIDNGEWNRIIIHGRVWLDNYKEGYVLCYPNANKYQTTYIQILILLLFFCFRHCKLLISSHPRQQLFDNSLPTYTLSKKFNLIFFIDLHFL